MKATHRILAWIANHTNADEAEIRSVIDMLSGTAIEADVEQLAAQMLGDLQSLDDRQCKRLGRAVDDAMEAIGRIGEVFTELREPPSLAIVGVYFDDTEEIEVEFELADPAELLD